MTGNARAKAGNGKMALTTRGTTGSHIIMSLMLVNYVQRWIDKVDGMAIPAHSSRRVSSVKKV